MAIDGDHLAEHNAGLGMRFDRRHRLLKKRRQDEIVGRAEIDVVARRRR